MTTITEYLAEQKRLAEAATEGPWDSYRPNAAYRVYELCSTTPQGLNDTLAEVYGHNASDDSEFIVAARESVPRLVAALEAVVALHSREVIAIHEGYGEEAVCSPCLSHWPCPTIRAIEAALGGETDG